MIYNLPFTYWWLIKKNIERSKIKTILELGCGKGAFGNLINDEGKYKITGIDIFEPYLNVCKDTKKYEKVLKRDLTRKLPFKNNGFDAVVCLQTMEHLDKRDGMSLMIEMERISKKLVVITTPNGDCLQDDYDENKYQRHLSTWVSNNFKNKGYKVFGTGLKLAYGNHSHAGEEIMLVQLPLYLISFIMNPVAYLYSNIAAQLIAVKDKK